MATVQAAVATTAKQFAALDDAGQEIYFTCTLCKMWRPIEILPGSWSGTLSSFSVIEVRKRPNIRAGGNTPQSQVRGRNHHQQLATAAVGDGWWTAQFDAMLIIISNLVRLASEILNCGHHGYFRYDVSAYCWVVYESHHTLRNKNILPIFL